MSTHHRGLNAEQIEAIEHEHGPLLVLAGAGSGKTRVVTQRIVRLIEKGVSPQNILGLTFTNKAAAEMQSRVQRLIHSHVLICTFHSLGARILRQSIEALGYQRSFTIYDEDDTEKLVKNCLNELGIRDEQIEARGLRQLISKKKNALETPLENASSSALEKALPPVYALYQRKLQEYNAVDFDDLLFLPVHLFRTHPEVLELYRKQWHYLLIDEYQDTNASQYEMVRLLLGEQCNLCVVGDPDQSIYSWRGANIQNILHFERDYPGAKIIRLEQNYRSRSNILEAANALIAHNQDRYEKNLWSDLGPGAPIKVLSAETDREEVRLVLECIQSHQAQGTPLNEIVIFYRTNFQSRIFEDALLSRQIPYTIVGGISFYQRREIKDILAYLRMLHSGHDYISFERTMQAPKRGVGPSTLERLRLSAAEACLPIFDYCERVLSGTVDTTGLRLTAKQRQALSHYVSVILQLRALSERASLKELVEAVVDNSGYALYLAEDRETYEDRFDNLRELISTAAEWEENHPGASLGDFLEDLSLRSSLDEMETETKRLNLMTLHNGKGLEFEVTFLIGVEEELFPHANARDSEIALEEERRLCYVGMTRAKEHLYLSHASNRHLWGTARRMRQSRFLKEIPPQYLEKTSFLGKSSFSSVKQAPSAAQLFVEGDLVFHPEFGIGTVESLYKSTVGLTYRVLFMRDKTRPKSLVASCANLTKLANP